MYDDDEDTHEVPLARRGVPAYASTAAPPPRRRHEPSRRVRSTVVVGASSLLAGLVAVVLALGAFTVLDRDTAAIPTDAAGPVPPPDVGEVGEAGAAEPVVLDPPVELVAGEPVAPFRADVRLRTTDGLLTVRLSAPTTGTVRWRLVGPLGRVVDRRRLVIGPRAREVRVRGLAAGRFSWRVVPVAEGPTRRGVVAVAGVPLPPPPTPAPVSPVPPVPQVASDPPVGADDGDPGDRDPAPRPPVRDRPTPHGQPHQPHPHHQPEVDPDDVPDPVDPSPRSTSR